MLTEPLTTNEQAAIEKLIADGQDINYEGAAGPVDFDDNGDVLIGAIETYTVDAAAEEYVTDAIFRVDLNTGEVTEVE